MVLDLVYGDSVLGLSIPDNVKVDEFAPATGDKAVDFDQFKESFYAAEGRLLFAARSPLVIVNDGFRSTPTSQILGWLNRMNRRFIASAHFLIATGSHGEPSEAQYKKIFGQFYDRVSNRISWHNAEDVSSMLQIGRDSFGEKVFLNSILFNHDRIVVIGSVEPHYFAGFTGGRKSLIPGLTDLATIERNHNLANNLNAAPLRLKGNPVAEHLLAMVQLTNIGGLISIQAVLDATDKTVGLFCGTLERSFGEAAKLSEKICAIFVPRQYDVVLCQMNPPLDDSLYQAQKGLENCQAAVKDNGAAIVLTACEGGVGSKYFLKLAESWDREKNKPFDGRLRFGSHKLSRVICISNRIKVYLKSGIPDEVVRSVFYEPISELEDFMQRLLSADENCRLAVVRDAGSTVLTC